MATMYWQLTLTTTAVKNWRRCALTLLASMLVFTIIGSLLPVRYSAHTILAPSEERTGGIYELDSSLLAGLVNVAPPRLPTAKFNDPQLALELINSRAFLVPLIAEHDWRAALLPDEPEATDLEVFNELRKALEIYYDRVNRIAFLSITTASAEVSAEILQSLISGINEHLQQREVETIRERITFLTAELENVSTEVVQNALAALIEEQRNELILIEIVDDFVFEAIDPPMVPAEPDNLSLTIWALLGFMVGIFILILQTIWLGLEHGTERGEQ